MDTVKVPVAYVEDTIREEKQRPDGAIFDRIIHRWVNGHNVADWITVLKINETSYRFFLTEEDAEGARVLFGLNPPEPPVFVGVDPASGPSATVAVLRPQSVAKVKIL